ncbi:hypothetical protein F5Y11DRAFT_362969 [Daldinia sp. FL1419]|nr:hypothetical protein F5Y11DRAFT_362969 [Daldinia sp. FL1419]
MSDSGDEQLSWFSEGGPEAVEKRIKAFFDRSNKFLWNGTIGSGANGSVYKVKYDNGSGITTLAVKICHIDVDIDGNKSYDEENEDDEDEVLHLENEKKWLERLRNCHHIIQSLDIPNDPLRGTPADLAPHRMRNWIFTEYIENGSLEGLVGRHIQQYQGELFPCRILWRFFMCLIRFCLEMAYWDSQRQGRINLKTASLESLRTLPAGFLAHKDLSKSNIAVGGFETDFKHPEHAITPILKLLDFGTAAEMDPNVPGSLDDFGRTGPQRNISDIGEVMQYLVLQGDDNMAERVTVTIGAETFQTFAGSIHTSRDDLIAKHGIDAQLLDLIYYCRAVDQRRQPSLIDLAIAVRNQVANRGHNGVPRETNHEIRQRMMSLCQ